MELLEPVLLSHGGAMFAKNRSNYAMFLAVLPKYRTECIGLLREALGTDLRLFVSPAHLDSTVKTGIPEHWFRAVQIVRFGRLGFVQYGALVSAIAVENLIVDLNPRSISAWILLAVRKVMRRRTLVWGHIHPQAGPHSRTAPLRRVMRKLSAGSVSYTYEDRVKALTDLPGQPVWVAPNSIYRAGDIQASDGTVRGEVLYVGRLEPAKKPQLLVRGFALAYEACPTLKLRLVGAGSETGAIRELVTELGIADAVQFDGWIDDVSRLREIYAGAFCSVSPGFAGLGLTQSLGFGVPMIVADNEQHSPEIELAETGGVTWFEANSPQSLAEKLLAAWGERENLPDHALSDSVRKLYSAEAMAAGLQKALQNVPISEGA